MNRFAIVVTLFAVLASCSSHSFAAGGVGDFMFNAQNPALAAANAYSSVNESPFVRYTDVRDTVPADIAAFVQYFEARNAMANDMLAPPGAGRRVAASLPYELVMVTCPACGGIGESLDIKEPDRGQYAGRLQKPKIIREYCQLCKGTMSPQKIAKLLHSVNKKDRAMAMAASVWQAYIPKDKLDEFAAIGYDEFVKRHRAAGDVSVGLAFVPKHVHDAVDRKTLKMVGEVFGKPCKKCKWTGVEECKKCNGAGAIPCPNKECKDGWIINTEVERIRHYKTHSRGFREMSPTRHSSTEKREKVTVSICPDCACAKFVICPECRGLHAKRCSKCHGLGTK